ncbi:319_t:CDS:2 [Cetraspora pellucida]|uniref:319_t:CDS:1 n=1 Tax=Cetraspora pellucida TaxID=1433469 RepID=A0ACA9K1N0_9GLOM|nr:319_t:CDS:2 [Cetraspora pellucida]
MNNIKNSEICDDDLETDSESHFNNNDSRKIESSSKSLSSALKDKKTTEEDVKIIRFNQLSALDIDEEICSEEEDDKNKEIDESTIKDAIMWLAIVLSLKTGKENKKDGQKLFQLLLKDYDKYPTLSLMYPIIRELQNKFIDFNMLLDSENDDNTHSHTSSPPPDLDQIEKQFKIAISNSLNKYWLNFHKVGLVATLLDP